jgi:hypothetical protein
MRKSEAEQQNRLRTAFYNSAKSTVGNFFFIALHRKDLIAQYIALGDTHAESRGGFLPDTY